MKEDQQQVVGLNIKDGRGGIRGELDTMLHFFFSLRSRPTISVEPVASGTMKDGGLMSPPSVSPARTDHC